LVAVAAPPLSGLRLDALAGLRISDDNRFLVQACHGCPPRRNNLRPGRQLLEYGPNSRRFLVIISWSLWLIASIRLPLCPARASRCDPLNKSLERPQLRTADPHRTRYQTSGIP